MAEEVAIIADSSGKGFDFAKGIYEYLKRKENQDFFVNLVDIEISDFKDGEFKLRISENIRRKRCFLIFDSNKAPCRWFTELAFKLEAMNFSTPEEVVAILPYMRFSRQDRKDESRVSVNSKAVADLISKYATRGMTVDLHVPQIQEYFSIPFDNLYSFPSLINFLIKNHKEILQNFVIVSPDLGGGKRAENLVRMLGERGINAEVAFGHKTREKDDKVAKTVIIGNVQDKNCLVVDDIIDTGRTMIKTRQALKEKGAKKIFVYGTHGLFVEGLEKFKDFDKVFISDTVCCDEQHRLENLEIVSLKNLFGEAIYRTVIGESLSILFEGKVNNGQDSLEKYEI